VGCDYDPCVQDVDQAAGGDNLDRLADVDGADVIGEPGQGDLAVGVQPPGPPAPGGIDLGLLCLLIWVLAGLTLLGAAVFRDALRTWPSGP